MNNAAVNMYVCMYVCIPFVRGIYSFFPRACALDWVVPGSGFMPSYGNSVGDRACNPDGN